MSVARPVTLILPVQRFVPLIVLGRVLGAVEDDVVPHGILTAKSRFAMVLVRAALMAAFGMTVFSIQIARRKIMPFPLETASGRGAPRTKRPIPVPCLPASRKFTQGISPET